MELVACPDHVLIYLPVIYNSVTALTSLCLLTTAEADICIHRERFHSLLRSTSCRPGGMSVLTDTS